MDLDKQNLPALVNFARQQIQAAGSVDELKKLRDEAETLKAHYQRVKAGQEATNACAEIKLRAEREIGLFLRQTRRHPGGRPSNENESQAATGSNEPAQKPIKLSDHGISRSDSSRWQRIADLPEGDFDEYLEETQENGEITTAGVLKYAKNLETKTRVEQNRARAREWNTHSLRQIGFNGTKVKTIYADCPWQFKTRSDDGKDRSAERFYGTASLADLAAMRQALEPILDDDAVLLMWAIDPMLPDALKLMHAWGFEYKTVGFTWVKTVNDGAAYFKGMGYWTRANPEMCLLGTRGAPKRLSANVMQLVQDGRREHSQKPDQMYSLIEDLVEGPYLELFARGEPRAGWYQWGNDLELKADETANADDPA